MRLDGIDWRDIRAWRRSRYVQLGLIAAATLLIVYLVLPRRGREVVSVDGQSRWPMALAPQRQQIVWGPAAPIHIPTPGVEKADGLAGASGFKKSVIRPQLNEDGSLLYFTLRRAGGTSDIYRSRRRDDQWQPAEPVTELNSPADDIGPVLRADGRQLWFYSNRPGGYGGYDLYVSDWQQGRWSEPRNLGPRINSPAHEYDPAVSPDGTRLFFASNRSEEMNRRLAIGDPAGQPERWQATLRADVGQSRFHLYQARRGGGDEDWSASEPLDAIQWPDASEGSPCVSPSGMFLYFASNRPARRGEPINYDIYRARLTEDSARDPVNLGPGVNTEANETEPALSREGFRLVFSRDEDADADTPAGERSYGLFCSEATETIEQQTWADSPAVAAFRFVGRNLWGILTLILTAALLAALAWYVREVSLRRLPVPGFLLISLLIHLFLGMSTFYLRFGGMMVQEIRREWNELTFAARLSDTDLRQSHQRGQDAYEKLADLQSVEAARLDQPARQVTEMPNVPAPETPVPQVPVRLAQDLPPDRPLEAPPAVEDRVPVPPFRQRPIAQAVEERVALEQNLVPAATRPELPAEGPRVELLRRQAVPDAEPPKLARRATPPVSLKPDESHVEPADTVPLPSSTGPRPQILRRVPRAMPSAVADTSAETLPTSAAAPVASPSPAPVEVVTLPRPSRTIPPATLVMAPITPAPTGQAVPLKRDDASMLARPIPPLEPAAASRAESVPPLARARGREIELIEPPEVRMEPPVSSSKPPVLAAPRERATVAVGLDRREAQWPAMKVENSAHVDTPRGPRYSDLVAGSLDRETVEISPVRSSDVPAAGVATARRASADRLLEPDTIPLEQPVMAATAGRPSPTEAARAAVGVQRRDAPLPAIDVKTPDRLGGPRRAHQPELVVGSLERETAEARPSFSPLATRIQLRLARAPRVQYAEDQIGLQAMFRLRSDEAKRDAVAEQGGSDRTLDAVRRGLEWLARVQHPDGYWSLHTFYQQPPGQRITGQGSVRSDVAATGLALLPFLGDGNTHLAGTHRATVDKAIRWLVSRQNKDGEFAVGQAGQQRMYAHGIATIALCETCGMSRDPVLRAPAQRAVDFVVAAQHTSSGGWRYQPREPGDTSVVGWEVMALKSAQMAGLQVPEPTLALARKWLNSVHGKGDREGQFAYQPNSRFNPAMSAEGLLCLQYLGAGRDDPRLQAGTRFLLKHLPKKGQENSYYWYYGTQVMYHLQGEPWEQWNRAFRDMLLETQLRDGPMAGSWTPADQYEHSGGRIYSTALRLLMLEVYYRHLPLYQVLQQ